VPVTPKKAAPRKPADAATNVVGASFLAGATDVAALPAPALPEVAFAGRSNVGKSSLMNTLLARKSLVRTSSTPGCTRQINLFEAKTQDGLTLHFVDLPGYGYAKLSKSEKKSWGPMLERYLRGRITLRAVVVLVDVRRGLEDDDAQLVEFLRAPRPAGAVRVIVVATKLDKLSLAAQKPRLAELRKATGAAVIGFSAVTGAGREELWRQLRRAAVPAAEPA
jgi:GTP-binding protein